MQGGKAGRLSAGSAPWGWAASQGTALGLSHVLERLALGGLVLLAGHGPPGRACMQRAQCDPPVVGSMLCSHAIIGQDTPSRS